MFKLHARQRFLTASLKTERVSVKATKLKRQQALNRGTVRWYPDNSGEWIEVSDNQMCLPEAIRDTMICVLLLCDRINRVPALDLLVDNSETFNWAFPPELAWRIVAYKVVH